jgi:hypothetical protein
MAAVPVVLAILTLVVLLVPEVLPAFVNEPLDLVLGAVSGLSPRTVETHVGSILHKLGVRKRADAARRYRDARGGSHGA